MSKQKRFKQTHRSLPLQQKQLMDEDSAPSADIESLRLVLNPIIDAYVHAFRQSLEPPTLMFKYLLYNTDLDLGRSREELNRIIKKPTLFPIFWFILSWLPTRLLVRLFISHHIQSRIQRVILFLQHEEIRTAFSPNASNNTVVELSKVLRDLRKFDGLLSKHIKFKLLVSVSPFFASIAAVIIKILPKDFKSVLPTHLPQQKWELIFYPIAAIAYLLIVLVPGFSFKRYVFSKYKIYYLERNLFSALKIDKRSKEFPLDLFGMLFSALFPLAVVVRSFYIGTYDDLSFSYKLNGVVVALACIFVIVIMIRALIGRYKSDNR